MPEVRLRSKGQLTIPAAILEKAQLSTGASFEIALVNGVITLTPKVRISNQEDIMAYAGIFKGAWGDSPDAVNSNLDTNRDEFER